MMCPLAAANWGNGSIAGPGARNFNNARNNSNNNVGFRADCGISSRLEMSVVEPHGGVLLLDANSAMPPVSGSAERECHGRFL